MIRFYFNPGPNPMKVALMLEETGLPYEAIPVDMLAGDQHTPQFLAINPNAKVPAIVDGDAVVFDSNAILLYLAENIGRFLGPPADRPAMLSWLKVDRTSGDLDMPRAWRQPRRDRRSVSVDTAGDGRQLPIRIRRTSCRTQERAPEHVADPHRPCRVGGGRRPGRNRADARPVGHAAGGGQSLRASSADRRRYRRSPA
jgi:glutathione S-transferase